MRLATLLLAAIPAFIAPGVVAAQTPAKPTRLVSTAHKPAHATPHAPAKPPVAKPKPAAAHGKPAVIAPHPPPAPVTAPEKPAAEPGKGSNTGMPLPRFAALRSDDVNFRSGPGTRYPIEWVYKRRDLPVEIEREFEIWRLVRDPQGNKGWVHQATLTGRRTAVVAGVERVLRQAGSDTAGPVARLQPGVIIRLRSCDSGSEWCQAQIGDYRGWIKRTEIWGLLPDEVIQ